MTDLARLCEQVVATEGDQVAYLAALDALTSALQVPGMSAHAARTIVRTRGGSSPKNRHERRKSAKLARKALR